MKIAVLPGDGIGVEIVAESVRVLERLRSEGVDLSLETAPIGGAAYDATGQPLPDATLELATTPCRARCGPSKGSSRCANHLACSPICVRRSFTRSSPTRRRSSPRSSPASI